MNPDILELLTTDVGLTDQEIADLTGLALGTVQSELAAGITAGEAYLDGSEYFLGSAEAPPGPTGDLVENIQADGTTVEFNDNRLTGIADPTGAQDAATKAYVDANESDELAKVSANDTTAGFLGTKLVAGANVTLTEQNDGSNETLLITATDTDTNTDESVKVSANDTTAAFLLSKLSAGTNITLAEQNDGGNETLQISASGGGATVDPVAVSASINASQALVTTFTQLAITSEFNTGEFTVNANSITVNEAGTYVIVAHTHTDQLSGGNNRTTGSVELRINSVQVALTGYYSRNIADGDDGAAVAVVRSLSASDVIDIRATAEDNGRVTTQAGGVINIFALNGAQGAAGATGPQGPAGNDGADGADGQDGDARISVSANDTTTDYAINKIVAGTNVTITELNNGGSETLEISASGGGGTDELAKVSANDTTAGFLNGKLVAGTNVTLTENNNGGNETLTIAASGGGSDEQAKVSANDTTSGFLGTKIVAGSNVTITELNDGSNETLQIAASGGGGGGGVFTWHGDARWDFDNQNQWYGPGYLTAGTNDILWNASYGTAAAPNASQYTQGIVFPRASRILKWTMWWHWVFSSTNDYEIYLIKLGKTNNSSSHTETQIDSTISFSSQSAAFGRVFLLEHTLTANNTLAANETLAFAGRCTSAAGSDIRVNIAMEWEHL